MAKIKRAILHIGTEKTGSTTIQAALALNRDSLAARGYYVPASLCSDPLLGNHDRLTTYALADGKLGDDLRTNNGIMSVQQLERHRIEVYTQLLAELSTAADHASTVLLTNEHCHSRLVQAEEVGRLHDFLADFIEETTVLVYLRPQHELALSLYDQALRGGYHDIAQLPVFVNGHSTWVAERYFDYADLLERWAGWFDVSVRIFSTTDLLNGDVLDDYLDHTIGANASGLARPANLNPSIGGDLQPVLNAINRAVDEGDVALSVVERERLVSVLRQMTDHSRALPARADAERFYARFSEGNERVRARFLPSRRSLFDADFTRYDQTCRHTVSETTSTVKFILQLIAQQ